MPVFEVRLALVSAFRRHLLALVPIAMPFSHSIILVREAMFGVNFPNWLALLLISVDPFELLQQFCWNLGKFLVSL